MCISFQWQRDIGFRCRQLQCRCLKPSEMNLIPGLKRAESAWEQYPVSKEFSSKSSVPNGYNSFQKLTGWRQVCSAAFFFTELPLWELVMFQFRLFPSLSSLPFTSSSSYFIAKLSLSLCKKLYILFGIENVCSGFKTPQNVKVVHIAMIVRKMLL